MTPQQHIAYHLDRARSCRAVLDRIRDNEHERRRATVRTMQSHVHQARQLNHAIIRAQKEPTE